MRDTKKTLRLDYIDAMKAVAIILVVIGHVLATCKCNAMTGWNDMVVWKWIYSFHMPLFMFVSGFVCFNPNKEYTVKQICIRILSYMLPFFIVGVLQGLVRDRINIGGLWYFRTLSIYVIVLYLSILLTDKVLPEKNSRIIWYARLVIPALLYICCLKMLGRLGQRFETIGTVADIEHLRWVYEFFLAGWLLRNISMLDKYLRNDYALLFSFFLCVASLRYPWHFYAYSLHQYMWIWFIMNLCSLPMFCNNLTVKQIGGGTASIYILHPFFQIMMPAMGDVFVQYNDYWLVHQITIQLLYAIPITALTIYLSMKLADLIKQSPLLSMLLLGDTRKYK